MTVLDVAVVTPLAAWGLATVLHHVPPRHLPAALDRLVNGIAWPWVLPTWNFFAPTPGTSTFHLLYRDLAPDGRAGNWREVPLYPPRAWYRAVWNPQKTRSKAALDVAQELSQHLVAAREVSPALQLSMPYLTLLAYVSAQQRAVAAKATQFLLLQNTHTESHMILLSGVHNL
jgi:hypothetical protein